jgi:putative flippase GtrA
MISAEALPARAVQALSVAKRFQKFLIVGSFGLLVNQLMLVLLHDVGGIRLVVASPLAILASMAVTFMLNEMWTWHDRGVVPSYID